MTDEEPDDAALVQRIVDGDEPAFVELYQRRSRGVYRFALQMSGSATTAEEVTQEVFLVLMRTPPGSTRHAARSSRISMASPATTCFGSSASVR